ncbi:UNVERIFIED_CONTAM: hypothetical protein K2H54_019797 [Gekko kuhli]
MLAFHHFPPLAIHGERSGFVDLIGVGLQCVAWPALPLEDPEAKSADWLTAFLLPPPPSSILSRTHMLLLWLGIALGSHAQSFHEWYVGQEVPRFVVPARWHEPVFGARPPTAPLISGWPHNGTCFVLVLTNGSACIFPRGGGV